VAGSNIMAGKSSPFPKISFQKIQNFGLEMSHFGKITGKK